MQQLQQQWKRFTAIFLTVMLVLGAVDWPMVTVYAEETEAVEQTEETETAGSACGDFFVGGVTRVRIIPMRIMFLP